MTESNLETFLSSIDSLLSFIFLMIVFGVIWNRSLIWASEKLEDWIFTSRK